MITKLSISNFKSIRQLEIDCKKINLFIGEPNTGKSNILEALALLSWCARPGADSLRDYVRFQVIQNLFYDQLLESDICISVVGKPMVELHVHFKDEHFMLRRRDGNSDWSVTLDHQARDVLIQGMQKFPSDDISFFRFKKLDKYDGNGSAGLKPPSGTNLFSVVYRSEALQETMAEFFEKYGLILTLEPNEKVFKLQKEKQGRARVVISYPYALQSDTLQRIIFYTIAMASNRDSMLVFEEPESNAFPYYTKYLGERIARDETNQFFIATHNPYLLSAIIEKGRKENVQVFIAYFKDYQTKIKTLTPDETTQLMEADPFFNLDRFTEEGQ